MAVRRSLLAAAAVSAAFLGVCANASAARPTFTNPKAITTAHFVVHYTNDPLDPNEVTDQTASDVAAMAETAYTTETQANGYPAPMSDVAVDGDPHIDIWIMSTGVAGVNELTVPDSSGPAQTSGYILLDPLNGLTQAAIGRQLFNLIEDGIWANVDPWFTAATTEWMGFHYAGFPADIASKVGPPDMSLDCTGASCAPTSFQQAGYTRWPFFQYLSERYGNLIVKGILDQGFSSGNPAISDISSVLASKGTNLADAFTSWAVANMTGAYQPLALQQLRPTTYASVSTGITSGALPPMTIAVNHLAARYLAYTRGDGSSAHPCYAATLSLSIGLPAGLGAKPSFYWSVPGSSAQSLTVLGSSASITVPWDTCAWGTSGYLLLPNPSTSTDGALFTVNATLTVDATTPAASASPPPALPVWGPVVPATGTDSAPTLNVYSPELIRVSDKTRLLRLIVFSSGDGDLRATLGSSLLGDYRLRAGSNDVRFVLPKSLVSRLRTTSGSQLLQLTSVSPGGTTGATVTRHVVVQHTAKKPVKSKKKSAAVSD